MNNNEPFLQAPNMENNNELIKNNKPFLQAPNMGESINDNKFDFKYVPKPEKPNSYLDKIDIWNIAKQNIEQGWQKGKEELPVKQSVEELQNDIKEGLAGVKASGISTINMIPGFNLPIEDHDNLAFKISKGVTDVLTMLVPVVGVEEAIAKTTATSLKGVTEALGGGKEVYNVINNNYLSKLIMSGSRATTGGALFGLEEAYRNQANNITADYEKSIKENALFGLAGGIVFHYAENIYAKYMNKYLPDYSQNLNKFENGAEYNGEKISNETISDIAEPTINTEPVSGIITELPENFEELFKNSNKEFKTFQTKPLPQFADVKEQIKKELSQKYKKYANYQENKLSPKVQNQFENDINKEFENLLKETNDYNKEVNKNINKQIEEAKNIIAENNANKIISQYKSMEDINAHITSSYVRELKGYDNIWKQSLEKNNVKNADIILTNKQFELPIMKLVRGLSTGDNELNKQLLPIAKAINDYTNHIFQSIKEVNPLIKEVKGYTGIVTHNRKLINNNSEEWEKFISNNGLMQEPLNAEEITEFKELLNKIHKTSAEQLRAYDYSIRRFKFVSPEAEFAYNNQFGNANTLFERLKNVGEVNARRISSIKTLGENQELTISKIGEILKDPEGAQKIANTLFPVTLGHFNNQAQIINAINLSAKASRLTTSTLNPLIQIIKYLPEDMVNLFTNISKDSSILKGIKYMTTSLTKQTPDFIKQMSSLNEFDKRSLKSLVQQLKIANEKAVHKSMGFFEVGGSKADNYGSFLENINSKINGSHLNDTLIRNKAGTTYATLLKKANQDGKLQQYFPTIPPEKLNKFIDKDGYVNPFINNDPKLKKYSEIIANKYFEFIEDVNPVYTKSSIISSPDSPSALLPVKMARWTQTVTSRTLLPLMKEFATTKGMSRSGTAGAKWLLYATSMTAISEATRTLEDWIEGKEHETKWKEISKDFLGFGVFGGMYWNYKLSYSKMIDLAKAGYYTTKANLFDKEYSDEQFKDFTNSKKNIDNASYIFRIYHSIHDRFEK